MLRTRGESFYRSDSAVSRHVVADLNLMSEPEWRSQPTQVQAQCSYVQSGRCSSSYTYVNNTRLHKHFCQTLTLISAAVNMQDNTLLHQRIDAR